VQVFNGWMCEWSCCEELDACHVDLRHDGLAEHGCKHARVAFTYTPGWYEEEVIKADTIGD
jgi:hypothetical protein